MINKKEISFFGMGSYLMGCTGRMPRVYHILDLMSMPACAISCFVALLVGRGPSRIARGDVWKRPESAPGTIGCPTCCNGTVQKRSLPSFRSTPLAIGGCLYPQSGDWQRRPGGAQA